MAKTEVEIFTDIIGIITPNIPSDWKVLRGFQPEKTAIDDKLITITKVAGRRYGFQRRNYKLNDQDNDSLIREEKYSQEMTFQLSGYNFDRHDVTPFDVLGNLITSLQTLDVIKQFIDLGYSLSRITDVRELEFDNSGGDYQMEVQFDFTVILEQVVTFITPATRTLDLELHAV